MVVVIMIKEITFYEKNLNDVNYMLEEIVSNNTFDRIKDDVNYSYRNNIQITDKISIHRVNDLKNQYNVDFSFNMSDDDMYLLLSFITDLDGIWYDVTSELWNKLVLDENDKSYVNQMTVEKEAFENMFIQFQYNLIDGYFRNEINSVYGFNFDIEKEVNEYVNDFEYKEMINCDELKELFVKSVKDLETILLKIVNDWFMSEEFFDMYDEYYFYEYEYIVNEIMENGFYTDYVN